MSQDTVNDYHQAVTKAVVKTFQHSRTIVVYVGDWVKLKHALHIFLIPHKTQERIQILISGFGTGF